MPITLTTAITTQAITQARIVAMSVSLIERKCEILVALGYLDGTGRFNAIRTQPVIITDNELSQDFTTLINQVPEMKNMKKALETYLSSSGIMEGAVT